MTSNRQRVLAELRREALQLSGPSDLRPLLKAAGGARLVLLGEASHGTSEFYRWRTDITKQLIAEYGFQFIAVEGDFPPCMEVNRCIKRYPGAKETVLDALSSFDRWPAWMWANEEVRELVGWLADYNERRTAATEKVGFYGLDVYSLWESMDEVIRHLERTGQTELLTSAKAAFSCFEPYGREGQQYGVSAVYWAQSCEDEVLQLLHDLQAKRRQMNGEQQPRRQSSNDAEAALSDELNALVAKNAESYYRAMIRSDAKSWNIRDEHMMEMLERLLAFHGPESKAIVWEHNTHIGDARATDMAAEGMVNVGQLARERFGRGQVFAVGFGTHSGTVIAGQSWGAGAETMQVPEAADGSWEDLLHEAGGGSDLLLLFQGLPGEQASEVDGKEAVRTAPTREPAIDPASFPEVEGFGGELRLAPEPIPLQSLRKQTFDHRAIGVVYHPGREHWGNYVPSVMTERYDAFVFLDRTEALHPLTAAELKLQR